MKKKKMRRGMQDKDLQMLNLSKVFQTGQDEEGAWAIRDNQGKTVIWLRFVSTQKKETP